MRALIAGGGIGGMAAAIALRRIGVEATVFERADAMHRIQAGGGYSMWLGGMRALRELGLDERVEAAGAPLERFEYWSRRGKRLARWAVGPMGRERFGLGPVGIMRPDLHRILADELGDDVIRFDATCERFSERPDGVTVQLAGGREEHGDLLIGADGLRSAIREQVVGPTELRHAGYGHWFGFIDWMPDLAEPGTFRILYGRGARFAYLPIGPHRLCWWSTVRAPRGHDPVAGRKERLLELFNGWAEPVEAVIEATPEQAIRRQDTYDRRPVKRWSTGRVTLLGDAAHPMTFNVGQGAGTSLKDGVMLAKHLTVAEDLASALRSYEASRRRTTATLTRVSRQVGAAAAWQNPVACALHDLILRTGKKPVVKVMELDTDFAVRGA